MKKLSLPGMAVCLVMASCATDQAAKMRDSKSKTVGVWGAAYRPVNQMGVVANLQGLVSPNTQKSHVDDQGEIKQGKAKNNNLQNITRRSSQELDVGVHYYPAQKSAFFVGLGVERKNRTTQYDAPNIGSTLAEPSYSDVTVDDQLISVGPSIGWDWIWPNGFSALMDLGPRWQVSKKRKVNEQDNSLSLDRQRNEDTLKKIDQSEGVPLIKPQLIIGYSW